MIALLGEHGFVDSCFLMAEGIFDELLQTLVSGLGGDSESFEFVFGVACMPLILPSKKS